MFDIPTERLLVEFGGDEGALDKWSLDSDAQHYGSSHSTLSSASEDSALWSGSTSLELTLPAGPQGAMEAHRQRDEEKKPTPARSGWCAIRLNVMSRRWDLNEFDGLCVRMRPDERRWVGACTRAPPSPPAGSPWCVFDRVAGTS